MLAIATPEAAAQTKLKGQWITVPYLIPINPVHMALMNHEKVLGSRARGNPLPVSNP
jgi:hypothetical protein